MALLPWREAVVTRIEDITANTKSFFLEIPELATFDFKPGQFVTLDLPIDEKPNRRWRSYSIASWPNGTNEIELCIVLNEKGKGTPYLFHVTKPGDKIMFRGPQGVFTLPAEINKDLFLICTGTGVAPFRSMAQHLIQNNIPHKDIYLIFGTRKFGDALYAPELKDLMRHSEQFFYYTTYSREVVDNTDHLVRTGYVHQVYEDLCRTKYELGENCPGVNAMFYICGWKDMIDEARARLIEMGIDKKSIHVELYG